MFMMELTLRAGLFPGGSRGEDPICGDPAEGLRQGCIPSLLRGPPGNGRGVEYPPPGVALLPQRFLNAYHVDTARGWGAYGWRPGDFIKHFAGCPWQEPFCLELMAELVEGPGAPAAP
jgi:hypothetical protein